MVPFVYLAPSKPRSQIFPMEIKREVGPASKPKVTPLMLDIESSTLPRQCNSSLPNCLPRRRRPKLPPRPPTSHPLRRPGLDLRALSQADKGRDRGPAGEDGSSPPPRAECSSEESARTHPPVVLEELRVEGLEALKRPLQL